LRDCFPPDIRRALKELPKSLDETYKRTLLGIGNAKQEYAHRIFQCLAVSVRPLCVEELAEVLAVRFDDGEDSEYDSEWRPEDARQAVLSACSSLITIVNVDGSPVVQFSHFSVKEFLMSSRLVNAGEHLSLYHIRPQSAHVTLSRACLIVLLNLRHPIDKGAVEKRPMAMYAARYWVDHAKFEGVSSEIQDLVNLLFDPDRPYFATWVWIYDVDHPWKDSMPTVHPTPPEAKPLYYAALCGFCSSVDLLTLAYPRDVNAQGGSFGTALNAAFDKGEVEIALALLQRGADINALDISGESSLYRATRDGDRTLVKLLLEHQADVNVHTGNGRLLTPLHFAAQVGELDICQLLLEHGADLESRNSDGFVPLHVASGRGHLNIVEEFLSRGADANAQDVRLWTPLHWASSGPLEVVQSLVRYGTELDKTTVVQETPLHVASRLGSLKIARFLIEKGANPMSKDNAGETPLHNASRLGYLGLVEMLLEVGVDVNVRNAEEATSLHITSAVGTSRFLIFSSSAEEM
jgi:ankyrin repeat protein